MGFMDKLGGDDDQEEVELKPSSVDTSSSRAPTRTRNSGEVELEDSSGSDDSTGGGLLPGMGSTATESAGSSSSRSTGSNSQEDKLEKVIEQNKKIIGLLKEIAGANRRDKKDIW